MAYLIIEDFRGGVDRRRKIYAGKPGTLWECVNAHITMGGDVEKRKAFVDKGTFGQNTFGLFAVGNQLYTFGSLPEASITKPSYVAYQRLQHPLGALMTRFVDADLFGGRIYVAAEFSDGAILHFYDGTLVADWNDGIVRGGMVNLGGVAEELRELIDADAAYTAARAGQVITVTAAVAGTPFTITTFASGSGALATATTTANVVGVAGVASSFAFDVTGGDGTGTVTSITVGGVEVLVNTVTWATSNMNTASLIAAEIALHVGTTGWTASASGQTVTITKNATGAANNNQTVKAVSTNTLTLNNLAAGTLTLGTTASGVTAVTAVAQVSTITLSGTFAVGDLYGLKFVSGVASAAQTTSYFGNYAKPSGSVSCVTTHKTKMYAGAGAVLNFSKVNDATKWNTEADAGAGFITLSNHVGSSEALLALCPYQGRLAAFARRAVQLWTMQNDDDLNNPDQVLENTGTRSPKSVLEFAGNDVFYLDAVGIRSLRARDASNNAFASGVGAPINALVRDWMRTGVSPAQIEGAVAVVEPEEARFWMSIGERIFVYSFFPEIGIAAWSWYEPGFTVEHFAVQDDKVWIRASDRKLYLYGGDSGAVYDSSEVRVAIPFTAAQKDGTYKNITGIDMAADGEWSVALRIDPNDLNTVVQMGENEGFTFNRPDWMGLGHTTHIAPLLTHAAAGYASLSKFAVYYDGAEVSG